MSAQMFGLVHDCYPHSSLADYALAMTLANASERDGTSIFPSVETMAAGSRQTVRNAQRCLRAMLESGWLQEVTPATNRRPAEYRINPQWIRAAYAALASSSSKHIARGELRVPVPQETRGDTKTPQENTPSRGDTMTPQGGDAGVTTATSRGDNGDSAYIRDPSKTLPPTPLWGADGFAALFAEYPAHRRNTRPARREWNKLKPDAELQARMAAAARQQARSPEWQADKGKRVPNLSKWLANEGWRATHDTPAPAAQTSVSKEGQARQQATAAPASPEIRRAHTAKLRELRQQFIAAAASSAIDKA